MFFGLFLCTLVAVGVVVAVALPHVRDEEQLAQDGARLARIARAVTGRARGVAEATAAKVGQSASSISGRGPRGHDRTNA